MLIHPLTDDECDAVLRRTNLGRLGCARDNQPYVVPIYFKFDAFKLDAKYLYSFANLGQKIQWMRRNPLVCVEVDDIADQFHWTTVIVFGQFEELSQPEHPEAADRAYELLRARHDWWQPAAGKTAVSDRYVPIVYRIRIDTMTGRRTDRQSGGFQPMVP
jgi:nitroimidazol reductase NimA-like FMN-containing flavoprotein (pyridoxamine 5'-phosphate oxidase superfamily)